MSKIDSENWNTVVNQSCSLEFDWLGIDAAGRIGIFSSLAQGLIPKRALSSFEKYIRLMTAVSELPVISKPILHTKEKGTFKGWIEYSKKGLFAFDYQDAHRKEKFEQYDLISVPATPLQLNDSSLFKTFLDIIPRFDLSFESDIGFAILAEKEM